MPFGDLLRLNTNMQAMGSQRTLAGHQHHVGHAPRLSTGIPIIRAEDDTTGYGIAKKLQAKVRRQALHVNGVPIRCGGS